MSSSDLNWGWHVRDLIIDRFFWNNWIKIILFLLHFIFRHISYKQTLLNVFQNILIYKMGRKANMAFMLNFNCDLIIFVHLEESCFYFTHTNTHTNKHIHRHNTHIDTHTHTQHKQKHKHTRKAQKHKHTHIHTQHKQKHKHTRKAQKHKHTHTQRETHTHTDTHTHIDTYHN